MATKSPEVHLEAIEPGASSSKPDVEFEELFAPPLEHIQDYQEAEHLTLSWRSWMAVFVACFANFAQVYVAVSVGFVIAFIVRDLGQPAIVGWIIRKIS